MPGPAEILQLLDRIHRVDSEDDVRAIVCRIAERERATVLSFVNAHAINLCASSAAALEAFRSSDLLLRDGVGVKAAFAALGRRPGRNMNGTDFIPALLRTLPPQRLAVYGTASPWLERGVEVLRQTTRHTVVDCDHGFHPVERYIGAARRTRPDVVLLAMGMPHQEITAATLKATLATPTLIVNGGAIVDFLAGRVDRAPRLLRRLGLEWSYRLAREPRRLFRRYGVGGVQFARLVLRLRRTAGRPSLPVFEEP
jgi:exopolysaccharide biosynthesis WecB/TagA/CpsF family protein